MFQKPEAVGPLSKKIELVDGEPNGDGSHCFMAEGRVKQVEIDDLPGLANIIAQCDPQIALAIGSFNDAAKEIAGDGLRANVISALRLSKDHGGVLPANTITRSLDFFHFPRGEPAFMLLDADFKAAPTSVIQRVRDAGGVWNVLADVVPALRDVAHAERASTSAGLYNVETGAAFPGGLGEHIYVAVDDASEIGRVVKTLFKRCWLAGLGWIYISKSGRLLPRTIVDVAVASPERLIFEGGPVLGKGLAQDEEARRLRVFEAEAAVLDTADIRPLTIVERARYDAALAEAKEAKEPEARAIRAKDDERVVSEIIKKSGGQITPEAAKAQARLRHEGVLGADVVVHFDDKSIGDATVGQVLEDPARYAGQTCADPVEPTYGGVNGALGRCKAMVMWRSSGGAPVINSFAHGGAAYRLAPSERSIKAAIDKVAPADSLETALEHLVAAPAMPAGVDDGVLAYALGRAKVTTQANARAMLAQRRRAKAEQEQEAARERRARQDQRIPLTIPHREKDPLEPTVGRVDEVLAAAAATDLQPPVRDLAGRLATIRLRRPPGLHWLGHAGPDGRPVPPPLQASISACANESEIEIIAEKYLAMVGHLSEGIVPRALPNAHLKSLSRYEKTRIGTCHAVSTIPLVTPDGSVLNRNGFDAQRGIYFAIPEPVRHVIPTSGVCDIETAKKSYKWLTDVWFVDVNTTAEGKAILISLCLTLIARVFIDIKPGFAIVAGMQGSGKTTVCHMISIAVLGSEAAAAAWSSEEVERQKSLTSYLLAGSALVCFDNIGQGDQVNSPTYDAVLTSGRFSNRLLGGNSTIDAAVDTCFAWTGNSISFSRDLSTRVKAAYIDADRADPSNRPFKHPDPLAWTRDNRPEILEHLFNVLTADIGVVDVAPGRFKNWYRQIGARIEACAGDVSFNDIAQAQNNSGDAAGGVGSLWAALEGHFGSAPFKSHNVKPLLVGSSSDADELRELFETVFPTRDFSGKRGDLARTIGWALRSRVGAVGTDGDRLLQLEKAAGGGGVAQYRIVDPAKPKEPAPAEDIRTSLSAAMRKCNATIRALEHVLGDGDDFARSEVQSWLKSKGLKNATHLQADDVDEARQLLDRVRGPGAQYFNDDMDDGAEPENEETAND